MKKRGQFDIFIYVIISLVVVFALVFGYKAVKDMGEKSKETMLMDFQNNFLADIAPLKYEDVVEKTYSLPDDVKTVCFVDYKAIEDGASLPVKYPLVKNSVESEIKKNVFLLNNKGDIINSFYTPFKTQNKIDDPEHYCVPVINGKATLLFGGKEKGLKGIAEEFEKIGKIESGSVVFTSGEMVLSVIDTKDKYGGNYIKFTITKKTNPPPNIISEEYDIQFCGADGQSCNPNPPNDIILKVNIDYPSCSSDPSKTYILQGSGVFANKKLNCENGKLVGSIP